jgi:hypothetical protein
VVGWQVVQAQVCEMQLGQLPPNHDFIEQALIEDLNWTTVGHDTMLNAPDEITYPGIVRKRICALFRDSGSLLVKIKKPANHQARRYFPSNEGRLLRRSIALA